MWLIVRMMELVSFTTICVILTFMSLFFTGVLFEIFTCTPGYDVYSPHGCIRNTAQSPYSLGVLVIIVALFIGFLVALNYLFYYCWDVVKSAHTEIKQANGISRAYELNGQNSVNHLYPVQVNIFSEILNKCSSQLYTGVASD